jgi:hypothetical protein
MMALNATATRPLADIGVDSCCAAQQPSFQRQQG